MFFFLFAFTPYLSSSAHAWPLVARNAIANSTADSDPSWVSSPDVRGTAELLISCITTLTLAAWTAYHPNIHPRNSLWQSSKRRFGWMLVVIVVPELVLYNAWEQKWQAIQLKNEINAIYGVTEPKPKKSSIWSRVKEKWRSPMRLFSCGGTRTKSTPEPSQDDQATELPEMSGALTATDDGQSCRSIRSDSVADISRTGSCELSHESENSPSPHATSQSPSISPEKPKKDDRIHLNAHDQDDSSAHNKERPAPDSSEQSSTAEHNCNVSSRHDQAIELIDGEVQPEKCNPSSTGETPYETKEKRQNSASGFENSILQEKRDAWNLKDAFFAMSGGFAVHSEDFWPVPRLTFTPKGVSELAKSGLLPKVCSESIADKSKADGLAKLLVCLQAGWFLIQCLARLAQHLPMTLLEVHVLVHVACAFGMYYLWLEKPYNVEYPIICEDEAAVDIAALFAVATHPKQLRRYRWSVYDENGALKIDHARRVHAYCTLPVRLKKYAINFGRCLKNISLCRGDHVEIFEDEGDPDPSKVDTARVEKNLERAHRAIQRLRLQKQQSRLNRGPGDTGSLEDEEKFSPYFQRPHVVNARSNLLIDGNPLKERLDDETGPRKGRQHAIVFAIFCGLYGGAHLSAWASHFPTAAEMWLWRMSAACLSFSGLGILIIAAYGDPQGESYLSRKGYPRWVVFVGDKISLYFYLCATTLTIAPLAIAYYARIFLLIEAFISLRSPPVKTYTSVSWSNMIPHVG